MCKHPHLGKRHRHTALRPESQAGVRGLGVADGPSGPEGCQGSGRPCCHGGPSLASDQPGGAAPHLESHFGTICVYFLPRPLQGLTRSRWIAEQRARGRPNDDRIWSWETSVTETPELESQPCCRPRGDLDQSLHLSGPQSGENDTGIRRLLSLPVALPPTSLQNGGWGC